MKPDELEAAKNAVHEGIMAAYYATVMEEDDPFRDCRIFTEAALASLFSAGFTIVRKDA